MEYTYLDRAIDEINTVHIVEEAEAIGNGGAVIGDGKPIDLVSHQVVDRGDRTKECIQV